MRIGVDLMGSDSSSLLLFEAVVRAASSLQDTTLIAFATQTVVDEIWTNPHLLSFLSPKPGKIEFHLISEVIEMDDDPLTAIRQKKNSSLVVGMKLLKKKHLDAFVSAGNTGALVASATLFMPLLPGIKRAALLATLPTEKGSVVVIDVGGNVSCKAHHLVQFALMGAAYQRCSQGIEKPSVGLLNIGVESKKGTSVVRQAYQILENTNDSETLPMRFIGNIEGREVFQGKVDVLVTDGFTGNVLLKTSEGVSYFILDHLQRSLRDSKSEKVLSHLLHHFDYEEYPGAIVCGIDSIAVKCHGQSTASGFFNAIIGAADLVKNDFIQQIKKQLE